MLLEYLTKHRETPLILILLILAIYVLRLNIKAQKAIKNPFHE